jgi:uncharacterized integral membrane protein
MRWIHLTVIVLFALAMLLFALQNMQTVTLSFLTFSVSLPLAIQAIVIYVLGMATGGSIVALLRYAIVRSRPAAGL